MGAEARKFVTQSIGRGSRIEPIKNKRKRIGYLRSAKDLEAQQIIDITGLELFNTIETLFVFGTKKDVINEIITTMKEEKLRLGETISLDRNPKAEELTLLIPYYKERKKIPIETIPKFSIDREFLIFLKDYIKWVDDDRVLLTLHFSEGSSDLDDLIRFKEFVENDNKFNFGNGSRVVPPSLLIPNLISHVNIQKKELEKFNKLAEEIVHFKKIGVYLSDDKIHELKEKIEKVKKYPQKEAEEQELDKLYGKISREEYDKKKREIEKKYADKESFSFEGKDLGVYYVAEHYYVPLLSTEEK